MEHLGIIDERFVNFLPVKLRVRTRRYTYHTGLTAITRWVMYAGMLKNLLAKHSLFLKPSAKLCRWNPDDLRKNP